MNQTDGRASGHIKEAIDVMVFKNSRRKKSMALKPSL